MRYSGSGHKYKGIVNMATADVDLAWVRFGDSNTETTITLLAF